MLALAEALKVVADFVRLLPPLQATAEESEVVVVFLLVDLQEQLLVVAPAEVSEEVVVHSLVVL